MTAPQCPPPRLGLPAPLRAGTVLLAAMLLVLLAGPVRAQTITQLTDLNFGGCDNVGGATYTVNPAATPGPAACYGAGAAQFSVTGTPHTRVHMTLASTVTIAVGATNLTVTLSDSVGSKTVCMGTTGSLIIYVGGTLTLPGGGVTSFGPFSTATSLSLTGIGGSC
jgi:Domain of unknown function (DUF4402)